MSKVVIQGNASGTGNFTIAAPNSNTDRTLTLPDEAGTVITTAGLPSGIVTGSDLPAGSILQVVQTIKTDAFSSTGSWADITGLSVNITPSSTSSKILVMGSLSIATSNFYGYARLMRDSNPVYVGNTASLRPRVTVATGYYAGGSYDPYVISQSPVTYLDLPSTTSQITYKFQARPWATNYTVYINRTSGDRDNANYDPRLPSSITVMEIAG